MIWFLIYVIGALISFPAISKALYVGNGGKGAEDALMFTGMGFLAALVWPLTLLIMIVAKRIVS